MNAAVIWDNLLSSLAHVLAKEPSKATASLQIVIDECASSMKQPPGSNGYADVPRWVSSRCRDAIQEISKHEWSKATLLIGEAMLAWEPEALERWQREHLKPETE